MFNDKQLLSFEWFRASDCQGSWTTWRRLHCRHPCRRRSRIPKENSQPCSSREALLTVAPLSFPTASQHCINLFLLLLLLSLLLLLLLLRLLSLLVLFVLFCSSLLVFFLPRLSYYWVHPLIENSTERFLLFFRP